MFPYSLCYTYYGRFHDSMIKIKILFFPTPDVVLRWAAMFSGGGGADEALYDNMYRNNVIMYPH